MVVQTVHCKAFSSCVLTDTLAECSIDTRADWSAIQFISQRILQPQGQSETQTYGEHFEMLQLYAPHERQMNCCTSRALIFYAVPNHPLTDPGSNPCTALPAQSSDHAGTAFSIKLFHWEIYFLQWHLHESYLLLWSLAFDSKQMFLCRLKIIMMHVPSDNQSVMHWWTVWGQTTMRFRSSFDAQSWNSTIVLLVLLLIYHHQQIDAKTNLESSEFYLYSHSFRKLCFHRVTYLKNLETVHIASGKVYVVMDVNMCPLLSMRGVQWAAVTVAKSRAIQPVWRQQP